MNVDIVGTCMNMVENCVNTVDSNDIAVISKYSNLKKTQHDSFQ